METGDVVLLCFCLGVFCLGTGALWGAIYGRKAEQAVIGKALAEFSKVDAEAKTAVLRLASWPGREWSRSIEYLKKHL